MNSMTDMKRVGVESDQPNSEVQHALQELGRMLKQNGYHFTTVTPATHARVNARAGNEWAKDLDGIFGWSRPFDASVLPAEFHGLMQAAGIVMSHAGSEGKFRSRLRASSLDEELFFHSAYPTSDSDAVFFGPDTYRFAQAIEQFIAARAGQVRRAVDIGSGAGPGAILIGKRFPEADVLAVDINSSALSLCSVNAALAGTPNVRPCFSNLLKDVTGEFDLIVSNPPYLVDPGKRAYRHGGGVLGADLSLEIIRTSFERLNPGGTLLLYTGAAIVDGADPFREAAKEILDGTGAMVQWTYREMDPDVFGEELLCEAYAQADRIAAVVLTLTKPAR